MVITTDILFHMLFERCRIRVRRFSGWSDIYQRNITLNAPNARERTWREYILLRELLRELLQVLM